MEYNFRAIEKKWQEQWNQSQAYKVSNQSTKPKFYVLDMFPYPSGAGLHVGHPLGYIASDIYSRYKRLKGFNVLHPMGYDAFGLPAEQYAIEHGIHPAVSTENNINNFRKQLDNIGFSYDWDREVRTCDPGYYKWTQWIFLQLFHSFFNRTSNRAEHLTVLLEAFENEGNLVHTMPNEKFIIPGQTGNNFTAEDWNSFDDKTKQAILMEYRLAYCGYGEVNWCEALGTVLANDEVVNGVSERGGHPVVRKKLRQWYLRITEYADRLQGDLDTVDWSDAMKEMQTNWIGKSYGAEIDFAITTEGGLTPASPLGEEPTPAASGKKPLPISQPLNGEPPLSARRGAGGEATPATSLKLKVYTTRPDTIFGVDFMVIAPEHDLVSQITTTGQKQAVDEYVAYVKSRSERERQAEKKITGCFTGAYALNPFNGVQIPIWISEYVLAGYGTGAIMAVPCGDERDYKFAKHFNIPITNIIGEAFNGEDANPTKDAKLSNSGFLDGVVMRDAIQIVNKKLEEMGIGKPKVNYRMRDAAFSRQRYWGEPFPIKWHDGVATALPETELPLLLPEVDSYSPGPEGEGPLANIPEWVAKELETNTMPGYAGSSWYFLRYMDPHNDQAFCDRTVSDYWNQVDLYIGGTEHAVGHLLYSRMWTKALYDLGFIGFNEPFKKLLNQGMIQGSSRFVYRVNYKFFTKPEREFPTIFISKDIYNIYTEKNKLFAEGWNYLKTMIPESIIPNADIELPFEVDVNPLHVDVNMVDGFELDIQAFKKWRNGEYANAIFILEDGSVSGSLTPASPSGEEPTAAAATTQPISQPLTGESPLSARRGAGGEATAKYICGSEVEKMSKSKFNTVNPDELVVKYGADTFRMYEMFLGPVEVSKPWDTKGIEGVHRFLKKLWRLFFDEAKGAVWTDETPTAEELKVLHKTIKKIEEDTERFSFNTAVSAFMIAVNELMDLKCYKKAILEPLVIMLVPYAPHIAEELYHALGNETLVIDAAFPTFEEKYVAETAKEYPVSINGKVRTTMNFALDAEATEVEAAVLQNELVQKWMEGKPLRKVVFVKGKMINVVV
jgi:leucyl-tRNA synthetase